MGYSKNKETGLWEAFYSKRHPITKKPHSLRRKGIKSEAEARRVEKALVLQLEEKLKEVVVPKWETLCDEYVASCRSRGMAENTIHVVDVGLRAATLDEWNGRFVDSLTSEEIRSLILTKYRSKSPSHQKTILKYIRCALSFAVEKGYLNRNPTPHMAFRIGDKIKKFLTANQVRELLTKAKLMEWKWYSHYAMALYTGLRNGELYALTWDRVDLDKRQILVDRAWNRQDGMKCTKSGNDRIVEIAPNLIPVLKELKCSSGGRGYVLPHFDEWTVGRQAEELRKFQRGCGLPETRFHDLRATWCTLMLSQGIEPIKVMKMGGWKDLKTMMYYIRQAGVDIEGITDKFDLHDPSQRNAKVLKMSGGSDSSYVAF